MTATTALRTEHDHILSVVACLRAACSAAGAPNGFDGESFGSMIDFIKNYADAWHHAKEETHLFPALEARGLPRDGGPIGVMLHEHGIGRSCVGHMADNLAAAIDGDETARAIVTQYAMAYADLLVAHIQKENGILFNIADQVLSVEEQARLERIYETAVPEGADAGTGKRYEALAAALCQRWEVDPAEAAQLGQGEFGCHAG